MSPDPYLGSMDFGDPQSLNRFGYGANDPINTLDPLGLALLMTTTMDCTIYKDAKTGEILTSYCQISAKFQNIDDGSSGGGGGSGFTLGIRAPGQSFNQCMVQNAANYSAGGAFDLVAGTSIGNSTAGQILAGNTFTGIYSAFAGSAGDAATVAGTQAPDLLESAMGSTLTFGRRTSSILSLNLAGKGGLPQALSSSSGGLKSLLGSASKALNLGLDASLKAAGDFGLFGAEIIGCSIHR